MKKLRSTPRVLKFNSIDQYKVSMLFNNGESRVVEFKYLLLDVMKKVPGKLGYELLEDHSLFGQMTILGNTVGWEAIGRESKDFSGEIEFHPYQIDPLLLFQNSKPDPTRNPMVGHKIKQARLKAGLTQKELASRSGTSKHYISRLENNKSDIELMTLRKIIEAGLGKNLLIEIR